MKNVKCKHSHRGRTLQTVVTLDFGWKDQCAMAAKQSQRWTIQTEVPSALPWVRSVFTLHNAKVIPHLGYFEQIWSHFFKRDAACLEHQWQLVTGMVEGESRRPHYQRIFGALGISYLNSKWLLLVNFSSVRLRRGILFFILARPMEGKHGNVYFQSESEIPNGPDRTGLCQSSHSSLHGWVDDKRRYYSTMGKQKCADLEDIVTKVGSRDRPTETVRRGLGITCRETRPIFQHRTPVSTKRPSERCALRRTKECNA